MNSELFAINLIMRMEAACAFDEMRRAMSPGEDLGRLISDRANFQDALAPIARQAEQLRNLVESSINASGMGDAIKELNADLQRNLEPLRASWMTGSGSVPFHSEKVTS